MAEHNSSSDLRSLVPYEIDDCDSEEPTVYDLPRHMREQLHTQDAIMQPSTHNEGFSAFVTATGLGVGEFLHHIGPEIERIAWAIATAAIVGCSQKLLAWAWRTMPGAVRRLFDKTSTKATR